jgi:hypothetical protein
MLDKWLAEQDGAFRNEVGTDARRYMSTSCSLKELEDLDDRFINNSPEGDNDRASNGTSD